MLSHRAHGKGGRDKDTRLGMESLLYHNSWFLLEMLHLAALPSRPIFRVSRGNHSRRHIAQVEHNRFQEFGYFDFHRLFVLQIRKLSDMLWHRF
jgi:hypothetical protein